MIVRKARINDVPEIVNLGVLLVSTFKDEYGSKFLEYLKKKPNYKDMLDEYFSKKIRSRNAVIHVAEDNGKVVGYSLSYLAKEVPIYLIDMTGYLSDIYVLPEYRGKGISSMLKDAAFDWFRKKDLTHASIKTYSINEKAKSIYRHWGFLEFSVGFRKKV